MIKALIAVRSGSERVKNKNIRPFAGKTLLEYKIEQLKRIKELDGIVVNSNDKRMLDIASSMGCETVIREQKYAEALTSMSEVYVNMAENFSGDIVVYCNVTNPLIADETISEAIHRYFAASDMDGRSVNTAHFIKEFMYLDGKPINYDPLYQPRSQDLPDIYALNFAVNVIDCKDIIRFRNIISPHNILLPVSEIESLDIDSEADFAVAEFLFKQAIKDKICY